MFTHLTYGLAFRVTMEMQQDDLYDVIRRMPASLADTVVRFKDTQCANIFNNAFTTPTSATLPWQTGMDGYSLCYASHPLTGGGTYQNVLSTAADLSVTSLETALYTFRLTVGDRNELLDLEPKVLLIPPQLERTAFELLKSSGRPDTANRADNWLPSQGLQMVVWNRLSSSTAWYLLTEKAMHNLIYYNRLELETDTDRDFNTKDTVYSVVSRFSVGWADWRGVFGTPGV
jgi:phage major head subunit gpT-like protein